jgi:uncharacterized protein
MVRNSVFLLLLLICSFHATAQSYTVKTVPNNKLINNSYVSNPDGLLSEGAVSQINLMLDSLEKKTTAQVAVVMLNSIGEADIFEFAQSLFVEWGIGKSGNDNGLLILYVQDQRTVRFHTGFGLEGVLPDATCKRIQTQKMVPRFKEGDTDGGLIAGIEEVVRIISNPSSSEVIDGSENTNIDIAEEGGFSFLAALAWLLGGPFYYFTQRKSGFANSKNFYQDGPNTTMTKGNWWLWYFILPIILLITITYVDNRWIFYGSIYGYLMLLALGKYNRMIRSANAWLKKGEYRTVYEFYQKNKGAMGLALLFPIPFAFLMGNFKKRIMGARHYPRPCNKCKQLIPAPLTETAEDEFLSAETLFEENLKSVDYDVWKCNHCGDFHYEMYINPKTKFTQCPKCNTYALYTASSSTKEAATTSSSGVREVIMQCKYCHKKTVVEETIPMISTSSDSSSSSSSSDSGGSWGGGDSGGGGASSSW